jgi:hypothetical protein
MLPSNDLPWPQIEWTDEKGGKREMRRFKKIIFMGLLAWALTFPVALCPGAEKWENSGKKETPKKIQLEKTKGKAQEEWKKGRKDAKRAGREFKESGKQFANSAKKESNKTGEALNKAGKESKESGKQFANSAKKESEKTGGALQKAGKEIKESLHETFKSLKKLFKG